MEPLIYIEQKEKDEATLLLKGLTNPNTRKRVFINALGAELLMKYLAQEGISVVNVYNMHNIFKIREEFDIADVMLPNIHIDVRVVYDKDVIFVPKSHFENNLVPDVYVVFNMAQDSTHVDFLGFIKPENIDKSKQNSDYYFIDKEQLVHPFEFIEFVRNFNGNTTEVFSDDLYSEAISLIDNNINTDKKQELINALKKSSALREEMIEFDNFEWLSYNASKEDIIDSVKEEPAVTDEFAMFEEKDDFGFSNDEVDTDITLPPAEEVVIDTNETLTEEVTEPSENLDINMDMPELEINDDLSLDVDNTEPTEDLNIVGDELPLTEEATETEQSFEESSDIQGFDTENVESADIPPIEESGFEQEEVPVEATEVFEETPEVKEEVVQEVDQTPEIVESAEDDLVDLVDLSEFVVSEDTPSQSSEDALEELVSLEDSDVSTDDSDSDGIQNEANLQEDVAEIEAYGYKEEPEEQAPSESELESYENENIISSENQVPGEIPIDINAQEQGDIGVLYDNNGTAEIQNETVAKTPEKGKKAVVVAAVATVMLTASAGYYFMNNNNNKQTDLTEVPTVEETEIITETVEQPVPEEVITEETQKTPEVANAETERKKGRPIESDAYLDVKNMGWSVPDYVSYNEDFKHYLQTLGKSVRLALSSDLLLATEYPYSNQVFIDIDLSNSGTVNNVSVSKSSGSTQIDGIVLRTVKETANVVKPPAGVIVGDKFHMTLKIYL